MSSVTVHDGCEERKQNTGFGEELPQLSPDTVFGLLGDCHRRTILAYLENKFKGKANVSELAAYVSQHACAENSPADVTVRLHHSALPKLAEAGLIDYDSAAQTVQYIGHPLVADCLDLVEAK